MNASIILVNFNGAELLHQNLPSVLEAAAACPGDHEVIVVDDASQDDSVALLEREFPSVRLVRLPSNQGFGAACNQGVHSARNPACVLLNTDMIVERDFLGPLIGPLADDDVLAVACKIMKWDKQSLEIGRTVGRFSRGFVKIDRTRDEPGDSSTLLPTLSASGGAVAYRRDKFLELGGFDRLFHPFYWEDSDLSYRAWKRGWRVLYQPRSVVYHKHQGTIGKSFSQGFIKTVYYRNKLLFTWRNVTDRWYLAQHLFFLPPYLLLTALVGKFHYLRGFLAAVRLVPDVMAGRRLDRPLRRCSDAQVLREKCR